MFGSVRWAARLCRIAVAAAALLAGATVGQAAVSLLIMADVETHIRNGDLPGAFTILGAAIGDPGTSPKERADLLSEAARLATGHGDFARAGAALAERANVVASLDGADSPDLAAIYSAAADAYAKAGDFAAALPLARQALAADRAYAECESPTISADYARIADILASLGKADEAAVQRKLADNAAARCSRREFTNRTRKVVITNEFADVTSDSFAVVRIFFATDRAPSGEERINDYFGGDRGDLEYGFADVTVPRSHKPGEIEAPSLTRLEWSENPEHHFVITRLATMDAPEMFDDLRKTLAAHKSDEAFIFIHGFNVTFSDAAKRTAQIAYDLNFDGAPILYSWPSRGSAFSYIRDEAVVRLSGRRLLAFLDQVVAQSGARRINLIAHSMGNRALVDALELMAARRAGAGLTAPLFDQIVFAAPDEDAALFAEMIKSIRPLARRLTLYGSTNDVALSASSTIHGDEARAGQGGDTMLVSPAIDSIDMSALGEDMLGHSYFAGTASALTDLLWLFWQDSPPARRCGMGPRDQALGRAWLFDPERCDGPVMLSALTLLKAEGANALGRVDGMLVKLGNDKNRTEADELRSIRDIILQAGLGPR